ncbi:TetR/AcrR family transcriptional regulator [Kineococcus sp. SYSU DK004]|uniref:TetR/AcrR family transcriptional regulator n=1 Tax=Kineococcus sp. SYSU DK004 TaxID=3383125 RepID=UPI003D7EC6C6
MTGTRGARDARRRERLDQVLAAAWAIAREQGLAAVTLHEVARRVGIRQPSLYSYVDSKAGLYDAMFAQAYRELIDHVAAVPRDGDPRRVLLAASRAVLDFAVADPARQQLLFQRTVPGFAPSAGSYALAERFLAQVVVLLHDAGVEDPADVDVYTALVAGLGVQQIANDPGGDRWTRHLERLLGAFLLDRDTRRTP